MITFSRLCSAALLFMTMNASSHTILLTAEYSPSIINPTNNKFTNTSPIAGYCLQTFASCASRGYASIDMGLQTKLHTEIKKNDTVLFKMPSRPRVITVRNILSGETADLTFSILGFGADIYRGTHDDDRDSWDGGRWTIPGSSGCTRSNVSSGVGVRTTWFWLWGRNNNTCTKNSLIDRGLSPTHFDSTNFMYELITPNPLAMPDGIYEGTVVYSVAGSGSADILLGGAHFEPSSDNLTINFRLHVSHDLQVKSEGSTELNLHACLPGKVCNEKENWENWTKSMVSNITPPALTARSSFNISSSGRFTVYTNCEFSQGDNCGIKSEKTGDIFPVAALLTLPTNISHQNGNLASRYKIANQKNVPADLFQTQEYALDRKGWVDFEVNRAEIEKMQRSRPDNFSGVVTLFFDPAFF